MAHAELPPSSADKWLRCGAWLRLNAGLPNRTSAAADEGTLAHGHLEKALKEAYPLPKGFIVPVAQPYTPPKSNRKKVEEVVDQLELKLAGGMSKDMADHLGAVFDWLMEEDGTICAELQLDYGEQFGYHGLTGTSDVVIVHPELLTIGDLKYGMQSVEVTDNPQLMIYLSAARAFFGRRPLYRLVIMQPRGFHKHGPIRDWFVTNEELDAFNNALHLAIKLNYSRNAPPVPGDHCRHWCKALATCPGPREQAISIFKANPFQSTRVASRSRSR